jgi:hypothetical protein
MNSADEQIVNEIMKAGEKQGHPRPGFAGQPHAKALPTLNPSSENVVGNPQVKASLSPEEKRLLVDLGTALWRLQKVVMEPDKERPRRGMKIVSRHLTSAWDIMRQRGLKVQSHTGCKFDTGQSLAVLAFQPTPGITHEVVLETVKPTLYLKDTLIQMGEVIVGIPTPVIPNAPLPSNRVEELAKESLTRNDSTPLLPGAGALEG